MNRTGFATLLALAFACAPTQARSASQDDPRTLRDELVQAKLENLSLKLKLARLTQKPAEELKILEESAASVLPELCGAAFRELAALPEDRRREALPAVLQRFPSAPEFYRIEALGFLGRLMHPDAAALVLRAAVDPSAFVRRAAAGALKSFPDEAAAATLLALFRDPEREVRIAALDSLGSSKRESAAKALTEALATETDALVLEKTVDALGVIGSPVAVEALAVLLARTPKESIRWSCINSLGKIGDVRPGPRLLPFIEAEQPLDVRQVAIESLGKLKETSALPRLGEMLRKEPEAKLRQAAATAFGLMAGASAIGDVLLPAYLSERTETVQRAIWASMLQLAGDGFVAGERLAQGLLAAGKLDEADQVCARLHALRVDGELRTRRTLLEEQMARALFDASHYKTALVHYRQLALAAPERSDVARSVAACCRHLKDPEGQLRALQECRNPEPLIEELHERLQAKPSPEAAKGLEQALRAATLRLIEPLAGPDGPAKKLALETVQRQGRVILPALASELEEGPKAVTAVLEAGVAITGLPLEPAPAGGARARAASWRAWLEKSP